MTARARSLSPARALALIACIALGILFLGSGAGASASALPANVAGAVPAVGQPDAGVQDPAEPQDPDVDEPTVAIDINGINGKPSNSVVIIIAITLLSVAPALLLMTTAFTKIFIVFSITRNALGLQAVPPNQVLAGLALFLSLFVMAPVLTQVNDVGVQPYLAGELSQTDAFDAGVQPLREFMLKHTRDEDLALITQAADRELPRTREDVALDTLVPAFVLSELRAGFIIGFIIFVPFLIIDLVVSAALMSMGMMMLPPITVSLPFKLLLFVMVDGWSLIITALIGSYG